ncbi:unnamed protein product [Lactuca saligna]|uniref:Protein transport protein SEC23 n=1 Tax=Lactuca saligna TaxID=75948 RepID=A0AA35VKF2_LACSI|nr:unnamed protein product [Lactuca saligna]
MKVKWQLSMVLLVRRLVGMETWPQYVLSSVVLPDERFFFLNLTLADLAEEYMEQEGGMGGESAEHEKFVFADVVETMHGYRRSLHRSPSSIISEDLSDPVHSHKDLDKDAALYFRKVGVAKMKVIIERTGGLVVLAESFGHSIFQDSFKHVFEKGEDGTLKITCSKDIKIQGIIGPCTSLDKLCGLDKDTYLTVFFDISSSDKDPCCIYKPPQDTRVLMGNRNYESLQSLEDGYRVLLFQSMYFVWMELHPWKPLKLLTTPNLTPPQ